MRKKLAAITIGGASLIGGGAGVVLGFPTLAVAQDSSTEAPTTTEPTTTDPTSGTTEPAAEAPDGPASTRVADALAPLVADGTLTQAQADKVAEALRDARPDRVGGPRPGLHVVGGRGPVGAAFSLSTVAEALGMTEDEVRAALRDGTTVAALAEAHGVELSTVTDALVAAATARIDEAVAAGRLMQARADEVLAKLPERIAELVQRVAPAPPDGTDPVPGPRGRGDHPAHGAPAITTPPTTAA